VEWIEGELLNFEERDYASHLHALFRYNGIKAAQKYIERVPKHFRNEVLYETLLASCVHLVDVQKAEEVFQKIMNLSSPLTVSACNQMLLLYKKAARKKVVCMKVAHMKADGIFMLMGNENVNPSPITYSFLIDLKGLSNDMWGVESVIDMMKANGVEPNFGTQTMVAKLYISRGLTGKAEEAIRAMEVCINDKPSAIRSLLDLYAIIGRPDDVGRIWELCTEPNSLDYLAAIGAWSKLGHIEQVEETFENLLRTSQKLSSKYLNALLSVYSENKLLSKGKEFIERMCSAGCPSDPITWDAVVSIYVNSGEVKKADSFLLNVTEKNPGRSPLFCSYIKLLKAYAEKWDFHNAEKIFDRLKKVRYQGRSWRPPYGFLLEAYVNAGVPAYGLRERMRADRVYPSKSMMKQLNHLENLQKPGVPQK
jgi:pentatricopeptide repeat protein